MVVLTRRLWLVHSNILVDTGQPPSDIPSVEGMKLRITDLPGDARTVIIRASWQW